MRPPALRHGFVILTVLAVLGCKSTENSGPSVAGSWYGTSGNITLNMTLSQTGQSVSGSGSVGVDSATYGVSISGSLLDTTVALTLTAGGYQPVAYAAVLSGNTMAGSMSGSGFPGSSMTVTRQ